jgi:hypothetical protein
MPSAYSTQTLFKLEVSAIFPLGKNAHYASIERFRFCRA